ncbi:hypothetical protein TPE_2680 [Treponema pedis str. T A4]|uniref:Uncharacterized protein n=1 Tax=Treponema pedis str. T A4 TaxID=1291379 RepID=S5ZR45_9SPIR|nr:hypothetical protein TPE_2680 [Treponema pedis str. T A4]
MFISATVNAVIKNQLIFYIIAKDFFKGTGLLYVPVYSDRPFLNCKGVYTYILYIIPDS